MMFPAEALAPIPDWFRLGGFDRVPRGWKRAAMPGFPARFIELDDDASQRLMVIVTGTLEDDGKRWLHVSASRPARVPSYRDLCMVKSIFIGDSRKAVQVFAPASEHVNIHPYCLHLWSCLDGDGLPDFRSGGVI